MCHTVPLTPQCVAWILHSLWNIVVGYVLHKGVWYDGTQMEFQALEHEWAVRRVRGSGIPRCGKTRQARRRKLPHPLSGMQEKLSRCVFRNGQHRQAHVIHNRLAIEALLALHPEAFRLKRSSKRSCRWWHFCWSIFDVQDYYCWWHSLRIQPDRDGNSALTVLQVLTLLLMGLWCCGWLSSIMSTEESVCLAQRFSFWSSEEDDTSADHTQCCETFFHPFSIEVPPWQACGSKFRNSKSIEAADIFINDTSVFRTAIVHDVDRIPMSQ